MFSIAAGSNAPGYSVETLPEAHPRPFPSSENYTKYEITSPELKAFVTEQAKQGNFIILDMPEEKNAALFEEVSLNKAQLLQDATSFMAAQIQQPRILPAIPPAAAAHVAIDILLDKHNGIIVGENYGDSSSKQFIIDHLPLLSSLGVKTLYIEHLLSEIHQDELNLYGTARENAMPDSLKAYLDNHTQKTQQLWSLLSNGKPLVPGLSELVKAAHDTGINVVALSGTATYLEADHYIFRNSQWPVDNTVAANYFASQVINHHQKSPDAGKYIALVSNTLCNTTHFSRQDTPAIPGLAEITGTVSIAIEQGTSGIARGERKTVPQNGMDLSWTPDFELKR